ncbi:MAG: NifB/NifX family molybdenum-iron cluster-binding protein [Ignavibacteriaceae bacterium]
MKIAVATDDNQTVAGHVGRCGTFIVFETDESKILNKEIRENSFTHHKQLEEHNEEHGQHRGHNHHSLIDGLKDCAALIFNHGGWRLIEDLKAHNIIPVLTDEKLAEDAVSKYLKGELIINEGNVCQGHHH